MVKYLIIAATIFCTSACNLGGSRGKMICTPEAGMLAEADERLAREAFSGNDENNRKQKEPLMLLRILTEF